MKKILFFISIIFSSILNAQGLEQFKNWAWANVSTGYNASATTIVVATGQGANFLSPASTKIGYYYVYWHDATKYPDIVSDPNREIVRVTARSGDTFTIVRGQKGTVATTKNTAGSTYRIYASPLDHWWNEIADSIRASRDTITSWWSNKVDATSVQDTGRSSALALSNIVGTEATGSYEIGVYLEADQIVGGTSVIKGIVRWLENSGSTISDSTTNLTLSSQTVKTYKSWFIKHYGYSSTSIRFEVPYTGSGDKYRYVITWKRVQ